MYNSPFLVFLLFVCSMAFGQVHEEKPPLSSPEDSKWEYDGFSYANFGTGEEHSYFSVIYEMNPKLKAELQAYYDSYGTSDILDLSYRVRWYPTKKVCFFSGIGAQMQRTKGGLGIPIMPLRMLNGVGYEPKKNISIEAVHDLNFNASSTGLNATPVLFTLKGKYRF